jgi:membrane protease YdiL (CAAX protease family)
MSNLNWLLVAGAAALTAAIAILASRRTKILGPSRLSPGESSADLWRMVGFALATWAFCILGVQFLHQIKMAHQGTTNPSSLSEGETVVYSGATELVPFAMILIATKFTRPDGIRQTGIDFRRLPTGVIAGICAIAIVLPLIIYVDGFTEWALEHWKKAHPAHELLEVLKSNPPKWLQIADVVSAGVVAPLAEEMFFRGILQTLFRNIFNNSWLAIILSSASFAMVHHWYTWPQIFFLGFCLGYAYERTGNLWMSITMHAAFNLTSIWLFTH